MLQFNAKNLAFCLAIGLVSGFVYGWIEDNYLNPEKE